MGGWLNHRHFLFPFINYFYGAYDAFLERMLMAVILVKDAVEQSRFAVQPASNRHGGEEEFDERGLSRLRPGAVSGAGFAPPRGMECTLHAAQATWKRCVVFVPTAVGSPPMQQGKM